MLTTLMVTIALAAGIALSHAHTTAPAQTPHAHVTTLDGNGGGPPLHP